MYDFIDWSRRQLQIGPCEVFDADLYAAALDAFFPSWIASNPPDPGDVRAFLAAHRRQAADDPGLLPLPPQKFGRMTQALDGLLPLYDLERPAHAERLAAELAAARALMLAEASDERAHPTVPDAMRAPTPAPERTP